MTKTHSLWTSGPRAGTCRFCGQQGVDESRLCPQLAPRLAAREAKAASAKAGA